jgi:hypothetical protein
MAPWTIFFFVNPHSIYGAILLIDNDEIKNDEKNERDT